MAKRTKQANTYLGWLRQWARRYSYSGLVAGMGFLCLSFTPSLLPRTPVIQGMVSGLSFVAGYSLGALLAFWYHRIPGKYRYELSRLEKRVLTAIMLVALTGFMIAGYHWQQDIRVLTQAPPADGAYPFEVLAVAAVLSWLLIAIGRGFRRVGRWCGRLLNRFLPRRVSLYGGGLLAAILLIILINGVLAKGLFGAVNYVFGLVNSGTPAGIYQPNDPLLSGSPQSRIDWNTLGEKGREFVASSPSQAAISAFAPGAVQPSRLYVGLESAPTLPERVNLLIDELNRTHADQRAALLIAIPTGSGGVDAKAVQSVEYLYQGDTTTMAIQYSYLPSWLSFLADADTTRATGKAVVDGIYDWWYHLDPNHRPKLLMYGESLGTLGIDGAFSGVDDLHNRTSGVLMAGPPNSNQLWADVVTNRDSGTREVLPTYHQGETIRFSDGVTTFANNPKTDNWVAAGRVGVIQHASDPVVWWSPKLIFHKPDWLRETRGSDVLPNMRWYPFVTFAQTGLDLPFAFNMTPGHGHRYGNSLANSWVAVLNMSLTTAQTAQLNQIIDQVKG